MTRVADIMTRSVATVQRDETIQAAAARMREMDVGSLPVLDGKALAGMVTDRDITVRGVAEGMIPQESRVADVMTDDLRWCRADDSVEQATPKCGAFPSSTATMNSSASSRSATSPRDNRSTPTKLCARSRRRRVEFT